MRKEARNKHAQGFKDSRGINNTSLSMMFFSTLRSRKYMVSTREREGHFIHGPVHSDSDWRDETGGSVFQTVEHVVAQGQG